MSSRRTLRRSARDSLWALVAIVLLIGAGLALARWRDRPSGGPGATSSLGPGSSSRPGAAAASGASGQTAGDSGIPRPAGVPAEAQPLRIAFTRDGDTVEANALAVGVPVPTTDRVVVRLLGIDAPETHGAGGQPRCYSRDAYHALQRLTPNGSTVWVVADKQLRDPYERYLLYVWNADGVFVNLDLARRGYARSLDIRPNVARQKELDAAVAGAQADRAGLWGRCVPR